MNVLSSDNVTLGRPTLTALKAITSIPLLKIKFPTDFGVGELCGDQKISRQCYVHELFSFNEDKAVETTLETTREKNQLMRIKIKTLEAGLIEIVVELVEKTE